MELSETAGKDACTYVNCFKKLHLLCLAADKHCMVIKCTYEDMSCKSVFLSLSLSCHFEQAQVNFHMKTASGGHK